MPSDKLHMDFMIVMCEMTVIYYTHHTNKFLTYEGYCEKIKGAFENPDGVEKDYFSYYNHYDELMKFLLHELNVQYGLSGSFATEIIVDFFTNEYWRGIYKPQSLVNDKLFPKGYKSQYKRKKKVR